MKILNTYFNQLIFKDHLIKKKINYFETNFLTNAKVIGLQYEFLKKEKVIDFFLTSSKDTLYLKKKENFDNFCFHKLSFNEQKNILEQVAKIIENYKKIKKNSNNFQIFTTWNDDFILKNINFQEPWLKDVKSKFLLIKSKFLTKKLNVLAHCDLHINNFLINKKKKVMIIDFDTCFWNHKFFDIASFIEEVKLNCWQINYFCQLFFIKKNTMIEFCVLYHSLFWFFWSYYYFKKTLKLKFFDLCLYHLQNYFYFKLIFSFSTIKSSTRKQ